MCSDSFVQRRRTSQISSHSKLSSLIVHSRVSTNVAFEDYPFTLGYRMRRSG